MSNAVPLSAFAHFEKTTEALSISHQGQFPAITVSFNLAPNAALGAAITAVDKVQKGMHMPASLQAGFQGTAASFTNSLSNEPLLILAALVTVYIVLGVLYQSFIHPITILSTLPSAGVGAFLALIIFRQDLSVVAIIGIVLLIGIVKKNGIMMVDFALEGEREHGKNATEAIYEAVVVVVQGGGRLGTHDVAPYRCTTPTLIPRMVRSSRPAKASPGSPAQRLGSRRALHARAIGNNCVTRGRASSTGKRPAVRSPR